MAATPEAAGRLSLSPNADELSIDERWRLVLGRRGESPHPDADAQAVALAPQWQEIDGVLEDLYEEERRGSLAKSAPRLTRWLGKLREHFPPQAVVAAQRDAVERYGLEQVLLEPELLDELEADLHLTAVVLQLRELLPDRARAAAERLIARSAERLRRQLEPALLRNVRSAQSAAELRRSLKPGRTTDWDRTLRSNLGNYQPELSAIVPRHFTNRRRRGRGLRHVHLLVDQSASMALSAIHASIAACILARLPSLQTRLLAFDTGLVDLTAELSDPVATLLGVQLGGGTNIAQALRYEQERIQEPSQTLLVLISDLYEGGKRDELLRRADAMLTAGVRMIVLLAISEEGKPSYDARTAGLLCGLGAQVLSCSPRDFPELMGRALRGDPLKGEG